MESLSSSDLGEVILVVEGKGIYLSNADLMIIRKLLEREIDKGFKLGVASWLAVLEYCKSTMPEYVPLFHPFRELKDEKNGVY